MGDVQYHVLFAASKARAGMLLQVNYTRGGLAFSDDWGALRNTANVAMLAFLVAQDLPQQQARPYECWAHGQLR